MSGFLRIGANKMIIGELRSSLQFTDFTNIDRDLFHSAHLLNARKTLLPSQTLKVFGFQKTGENNMNITELMSIQEFMVIGLKLDLFLLVTQLDASKMIMISISNQKQLQTTKVKLFQPIGDSKMNTGELMLSQEFIDLTNKDLFQLATLLDAKLIPWLSHQTMLVLPLIGDTLTSTGKLMLPDQSVRETCLI
jgi:hypothetical protein